MSKINMVLPVPRNYEIDKILPFKKINGETILIKKYDNADIFYIVRNDDKKKLFRKK